MRRAASGAYARGVWRGRIFVGAAPALARSRLRRPRRAARRRPHARGSPRRPRAPHQLPVERSLTSPAPSPRSCGTLYLGDRAHRSVTVPVGVGAAIYLEEYADQDRWYNRLIELNIQNLAGRAVDRLRHPRARVHRARPRPRHGAPRRRAHPLAARPADRDHRLARGDPGRARVDPGRRARARRDPVADGPAPGAARRDPGHRDRLDPRPRRGRSARPRR